MTYVTQITVIRNLGLKLISIVLLDLQIFTLVRKKHSTILFRFKVSIHKVFHQHGYCSFTDPVIMILLGSS